MTLPAGSQVSDSYLFGYLFKQHPGVYLLNISNKCLEQVLENEVLPLLQSIVSLKLGQYFEMEAGTQLLYFIFTRAQNIYI